ncbi:potassium channel family protein [Mycoplasma procyoni]|uniref:potassium channel family protein n=1 Tax=Mycoplasma procyoni TaxID=568784 RepID=UPI00197C9A7E|nr:potassium channel family protein [Mycoplasma procyoni]MBN3535114.1 potassium channel family protein [Mycoplasma procyoni]
MKNTNFLKTKLGFLKSRYFIDVLDNIVGSRYHLKKIEDKDKHAVTISKWIYFAVVFFFSFYSILVTGIFGIIKDEQTKTSLLFFVAFSEIITFFLFLFDYFLWFWSAPARNIKGSKKPRLRFLFSSLSFSLIISLLPSLYVIDLIIPNNLNIPFINYLKSFKFLRMIRILMLLNIFRSFSSLFSVFKTQKTILINVFVLLFIIVILFSLVILDVETDYVNSLPADQRPSSYVDSFSKAIYFTTISLTTIGYGDISPQSDIAKTLVMIMSVIGIAIFAIPSGVIAGTFLTKMQSNIEKKRKQKEEQLQAAKETENTENTSSEEVIDEQEQTEETEDNTEQNQQS